MHKLWEVKYFSYDVVIPYIKRKFRVWGLFPSLQITFCLLVWLYFISNQVYSWLLGQLFLVFHCTWLCRDLLMISVPYCLQNILLFISTPSGCFWHPLLLPIETSHERYPLKGQSTLKTSLDCNYTNFLKHSDRGGKQSFC